MGQSVSRVGAQPIDNQLLKPKVVKCLEERRLKRYILQGKLAPCYEGLADEESNDFQGEECPICFLNFPALNSAECCSKRICTECFLQVSGRTCVVSDVVCPFCKAPNFAVKFCGPRSKEEQLKEWEEHQKAVAAEISASQSREQPLFSEEEINAVRRSQRSSGGSNSNVNRSRQRSRNPSNNNSGSNIPNNINNNSSTDALILNHSESETQSTNNSSTVQQPHPLWTQSEAGMLDMSNNMQRVHLGNVIGRDLVQSPPGVLELCRDLGMSLEEINEMLLEHAIAASVLQLTQSQQRNEVETDTQEQEQEQVEAVEQAEQQGEQQQGQEEDENENEEDEETGLRHRNVQEEQPQSSSISCWNNEVPVSLHLNQQQDCEVVQLQLSDQQATTSSQQQLTQGEQIQISQPQKSSSSSSFAFPVVDLQPDLISSDPPSQISQSGEILENQAESQEQLNDTFSLWQSEQQPNQFYHQSDFTMKNQHLNSNSNQSSEDLQLNEIQLDVQDSDVQCTSQMLMLRQQGNDQSELQENSGLNAEQQQQQQLEEGQDEGEFIDVGELGDVENPPEAIIVDLPDDSSVLGLLLINDKIVAEIVSVDEEEATGLCPSISFVRDERDQAVQVVISRGDESVREQIQSGDVAVQRATQSTDNYLERLRRLDDEFKAKLEQMDRVVQRNFQ